MHAKRTATFILLLVAGLLWLTPAARADDAERAVALVERTAAALSEDAAATLTAINRAEAPYQDPRDPTHYVFVYDMELTIVAHPRPDLVGRNMKGKPDAAGKHYRDEILAGAQSAGEGWEDYHYTKPGSEGIHPKRAYYRRAAGSDGRDYIVCGGIYLD